MQVETREEAMLTIKGSLVLILSLVLFQISNIRGTDYANGDSGFTARRLTAVENAAPLWVWGVAFITIGCAGSLFLMYKLWSAVVFSQIISGGLYAALATGIFLDSASRMDEHPIDVTLWVAIPALVVLTAFVRMLMNLGHAKTIFAITIIGLWMSLLTAPLDGLRNAIYLLGIGLTHVIIAISIAQNKEQYETLLKKIKGT